MVAPWHILPLVERSRKPGDIPLVDTILTLVIAVGGIATGLGAIWAALLARRQAQLTERSIADQRQFLEEQTEIAGRQARVGERQAQATEQSLAQTERSLAEQVESLHEQNERARITLEFDLLTRMEDSFMSPQWLSTRRGAARYLLDNAFVGDDIVEVPSLNNAAVNVCGYYDEIGDMRKRGVLSDEAVWNRFSARGQAYWLLCKPGVEGMREEWEDPTWFEDFEDLSHRIAEMEREHGISPPTKEVLRRIMEDEAVIGEEPSATTTE